MSGTVRNEQIEGLVSIQMERARKRGQREALPVILAVAFLVVVAVSAARKNLHNAGAQFAPVFAQLNDPQAWQNIH